MTTDEMFMQRCLFLAALGQGHVSPNPMVGCVIVKDGSIVSEGYHQEYGHNHAERNAILRARERGINLAGSVLYVSLEPCSHHGHTPPCADLIVESGIKKVVCCNDDPNPKVDGGGFRKLEEAAIDVVRHVLESQGRHLNRRFFTCMEQHRPYIILKWAESGDGFIAPPHGQTWLSSQRQNRLNHRWRTQEAAILIGSNTYLTDHPSLTARYYFGTNPTAVVLDRRHRISNLPQGWLHCDKPTIEEVVQDLYNHDIQSVIVEGGAEVLNAFIRANLYDEVRILRSNCLLHEGIKAPFVPPLDSSRLIVVTP